MRQAKNQPASLSRAERPGIRSSVQSRTAKEYFGQRRTATSVARLSRRRIWIGRRRNELARLFQDRERRRILVADISAWALLVADTVAISHPDELDFFRCNDVARRIGLELPEAVVMQAIRRTTSLLENKLAAYRPIAATTAGKMLTVAVEEKAALGLRTFHAFGDSRAERLERNKAAKRQRDRERQRAKRTAEGRAQRPIYEAESLSRAKPWQAEGISRATWYRRHR